jgi:hypothetical protein
VSETRETSYRAGRRAKEPARAKGIKKRASQGGPAVGKTSQDRCHGNRDKAVMANRQNRRR